MECVRDIIIGLVSGVISSFIVTFIWHRKMLKIDASNKDNDQKKEYVRQFKEDIQTLCHYLDHLELELSLPETADKLTNIRRLIDSRPGTSSFVGGMREDGITLMMKLNICLREMDDEATRNTLSTSKCNIYMGRLFILKCDLLKNQDVIRRPWSEYKQISDK